jgi:hypothetical protein
MLEDKRTEFANLFREFVNSYLPSPDGRDHIRRYPEERKDLHRLCS